MDEGLRYVIIALIGFLIGGAVGSIWFSGFFPAAWGGLILGLGGCYCLARDFFV